MSTTGKPINSLCWAFGSVMTWLVSRSQTLAVWLRETTDMAGSAADKRGVARCEQLNNQGYCTYSIL